MDSQQIAPIRLSHLSLIFIPVLIVLIILFVWNIKYKYSIYVLVRMFIQLILVGYVLNILFEVNKGYIVGIILIIMLFISSGIAMRTMLKKTPVIFLYIGLSILIGGGLSLYIMTQLVLNLTPWYDPVRFIPLSGMVLSNCMNGISLAAERFENELAANNTLKHARVTALNTALIPIINSCLAVGLVSIPGMMSGQILAGVSPLIAVRYQIMIQGSLFGSIGISVFLFLSLMTGYHRNSRLI